MEPRKYHYNNSTLTIIFGDILQSKAEVIVSSDDTGVSMSGGLSGSIRKAGGEAIRIDAQKKWSRIESYGPKFVENIVQAVSRDILAYAMSSLSHCSIVGHVHDELIIEADEDVSLQDVCGRMGQAPWWLPGIELRADGYECGFYMKD